MTHDVSIGGTRTGRAAPPGDKRAGYGAAHEPDGSSTLLPKLSLERLSPRGSSLLSNPVCANLTVTPGTHSTTEPDGYGVRHEVLISESPLCRDGSLSIKYGLRTGRNYPAHPRCWVGLPLSVYVNRASGVDKVEINRPE